MHLLLNLSWIPETHLVEGENWLPRAVFTHPQSLSLTHTLHVVFRVSWYTGGVHCTKLWTPKRGHSASLSFLPGSPECVLLPPIPPPHRRRAQIWTAGRRAPGCWVHTHRQHLTSCVPPTLVMRTRVFQSPSTTSEHFYVVFYYY